MILYESEIEQITHYLLRNESTLHSILVFTSMNGEIEV